MLPNKNYDRWCAQMRVVFWYQEVIEIVRDWLQELEKKPFHAQRTTHHEVEKKDDKALFIIHQYVDANNFEKIVLANTEKEA